jgi:hypothetical protein
LELKWDTFTIYISVYMAASGAPTKQFSPFLHAWHDPLAGLKVHSSCVQLADLDCDGDSKLCICDLDKKLKIYKGTALAVEYAILDTPVAMCIIYSELALVSIRAGTDVCSPACSKVPLSLFTCSQESLP